MTRSLVLCCALGAGLALLRAEPGLASAGPQDRAGGAAVYGAEGGPDLQTYRDDVVFAVTATPGRITDIVLEPGERLVGAGPVAAGDTARWVIGDTTSGEGPGRRVHVMIKPIQVGLATNLIINTDRRTYHLEIRSATQGWRPQLAWRYPPAIPLVPAPRPSATPARPPPPDLTRLNFAYRLKGARTVWRPLRVFDDGARTYLDFAPSVALGDLPPLFSIAADGKRAELINYTVAGSRIVVDRLFDRAELRLGQGPSARRVSIVREASR